MVGGGEGNDQLWGSGRGAIAGCQSVSYLPSIFKATNFTQTPKKTAMNFVLSFLQTVIYTVFYFANIKICFCYLGSMLV